MKHFTTILLTIALVGCASGPNVIKSVDTWDSSKATAITQKIALLSDTQFHESRGRPSRYFQRSGDEFEEVTIRSAQQVIGADDILEHALDQARAFPLMLHAGDALDVSCSTEWARFTASMLRRGPPGPNTWLFTPGNHDGFAVGNIYPTAGTVWNEGYWNEVCNAGMIYIGGKYRHTSFGKNLVIDAYIKLFETSLSMKGDGISCNADESYCRKVHRDDSQPWRSFVVQMVKMPASDGSDIPVYGILIDSSDYALQPTLNYSGLAGLWAGVSSAQLEAAIGLRNRVPVQGKYFLLAHHPIKAWRTYGWLPGKSSVWQDLISDYRSLRFIVTSHTHRGDFIRHSNIDGGLVELNTGSLADAPIYIRTIQFEKGTKGEIGFRTAALNLNPTEFDCKTYVPSPPKGPLDYGVDTQRTERAKGAESSWLVRNLRSLGSAWRSFLNIDDAKHDELRPQLLAYADIVQRTFPEEQVFAYKWTSTEDAPGYALDEISGRGALIERLRSLANCRPSDGTSKCTIQAKENILLELDSKYRSKSSIPKEDLEYAHRMRLCMALSAADDSPSVVEKVSIEALRKRIEENWSIQLSPQAKP